MNPIAAKMGRVVKRVHVCGHAEFALRTGGLGGAGVPVFAGEAIVGIGGHALEALGDEGFGGAGDEPFAANGERHDAFGSGVRRDEIGRAGGVARREIGSLAAEQRRGEAGFGHACDEEEFEIAWIVERKGGAVTGELFEEGHVDGRFRRIGELLLRFLQTLGETGDGELPIGVSVEPILLRLRGIPFAQQMPEVPGVKGEHGAGRKMGQR